jgi:hypothetical protein
MNIIHNQANFTDTNNNSSIVFSKKVKLYESN